VEAKMQKLYQDYQYMKSFKARVTSCTKSDRNFDDTADELYDIELENTAFYPESGGQPCDFGYIGSSKVVNVYEDGDRVVHVCTLPLEVGQEYKAGIHWLRRFDHMQHHTAEHIISGIILKLHGADNVGFSVSDRHVTLDFNVELDEDDIMQIEYLANEAVFKNLPINVNYFDSTPDFSYRSKRELSGTIRIISVDDYDVCACCGTHLATTGEVGLIKIESFQKYKSGSRLYLLCGGRALNDYMTKDKNISEISELLSCKPYETAKYVKKLHEDKDELRNELITAKFAIIDMQTEKLEPAEKRLIFEDNLSSDEMKKYVTNLSEKTDTVAVFSGNDTNGYRYMVTSRALDLPSFVKSMNDALNGKGGGKGIAGGHVNSTRPLIESFFNQL
jgi:alanyl-tRNA synthetase